MKEILKQIHDIIGDEYIRFVIWDKTQLTLYLYENEVGISIFLEHTSFAYPGVFLDCEGVDWNLESRTVMEIAKVMNLLQENFETFVDLTSDW